MHVIAVIVILSERKIYNLILIAARNLSPVVKFKGNLSFTRVDGMPLVRLLVLDFAAERVNVLVRIIWASSALVLFLIADKVKQSGNRVSRMAPHT